VTNQEPTSGETDVPDGSAIALKLGIELVKRITPTGLAWIRAWFQGRKILVVGQPRAGKTSFVRYLQYGIFTDPDEKSPRTRKVRKSASFTVGMGKDQALKMQVRSTIDTVGQALASEHAANTVLHHPDALVIIVDLASDWRGQTEYQASHYLGEFCDHLAGELSEHKKLRKKLKAVVVVLNKKDLASNSKIISWRRGTERILEEKLRASFGARVKDVPILSCSLIERHDTGRSANAVIEAIALALS